jgi:hypothetical protein
MMERRAYGEPDRDRTGYSALEIATLALSWLGEGIFERGGIELMRRTLDAGRAGVAGPGFGTWPRRRG